MTWIDFQDGDRCQERSGYEVGAGGGIRDGTRGKKIVQYRTTAKIYFDIEK
jgi:hypothetical protein